MVAVARVLVLIGGLLHDRRLGGGGLQPCVFWSLSDSPESRIPQTSPERQLQAGQELSNQRGHEEVGVADDFE